MATFDRIKRLFGGADATERRGLPRDDEPKAAHVLVVDDSPTICAVLGKMLNQAGYSVITAGDGEKAIALACSEQPDLIFLDIVMPGLSGFDVLRTLRREPLTHGIPIVMISGNLQATEQFYVQRFGADDFMKKPFGRGEVFARIQSLSKSGRLVVRERNAEPVIAEPGVHGSGDEIPDIAMPDLHDQ